MVSDGTNQTTTLGLSNGKLSNMVFNALQAIKVLPPAVGTFTVTLGTPLMEFVVWFDVIVTVNIKKRNAFAVPIFFVSRMNLPGFF